MAEYKECRHIMPSGLHCKSPAMRGSVFCYFHGRPPRPARPGRPLETTMDIPPVVDSGTTLDAISQILQALAANRITSRRAAVLLFGVQMALGQQACGSVSSGSGDLASILESLLDSPRSHPDTPNAPAALEN
jgi:hypothetical protein